MRLLIVKDGLETGGSAGRLMLTVLAGVAQLERDLISERTRMGIKAARMRGAKLGRPAARVPQALLREIKRGERTATSVARELGVSAMTVRRRLAAPS